MSEPIVFISSRWIKEDKLEAMKQAVGTDVIMSIKPQLMGGYVRLKFG
jgi:hypothetical protein